MYGVMKAFHSHDFLWSLEDEVTQGCYLWMIYFMDEDNRGSPTQVGPSVPHMVMERQLPTAPITGNTSYTSLRSIADSYNQPYTFKGFTFIWFFYLDSSPLETREDCQLELWRAGSYLNGLEVLNKDLMLADSPTSEESCTKTGVSINICDSLSRPCLLMYGFCKMLMVCSLIDAHV